MSAGTPTSKVRLREMIQDDLPIFFKQQLDPQANWMAAFTAKDPSNHQVFEAHWEKVLPPVG